MRLTDEQRRLVEEHAGLAEWIAARAYRRMRLRGSHDFAEVVQEARVGLCQAAAAFDPARGAKFATFARPRIAGAVVDWVRRASGHGQGAGRTRLAAGAARPPVRLYVLAEAMSGTDDPVLEDEVLESPDLPVGWELESEDEVRRWCRRLPGRWAAVLQSLLLDAACGGQAGAGRKHGVSASRASQIVTGALAMMREHAA